METLLIVIAVITFCYSLYTLLDCFSGFKKIHNLSNQPLCFSDQAPRISIIVSALNEEHDIENTILTLLNLSYPDLELIAVNDRSTDRTGVILDRLQSTHPQLQVIHVKTLPAGWFGKNHALHLAAQQASGEWLLFTDADVVMHKEILQRAMSYVQQHGLDHLTMFEYHPQQDIWLKTALLGSYLAYSMAMKPWRIRDAQSKKSLGHGAFNLIKKSVYQQCGGHAAIALQCLDDLKLGALVKQHGFKQDTVDGRDYIQRAWYDSLRAMIIGLRKNSFAFYNYRLVATLRDCCLALVFYFLPFVGVVGFSGPIRVVNAMNIGLMLLIVYCVVKHFRFEKKYIVLYPIGVGMLLWTLLNSAISICRQRGVTWRGTYYPLSMIRK